MGNQAVLEKAIRLAIDNGWERQFKIGKLSKLRTYIYLDDTPMPVYEVIFNHDFCQAIWGDEVKSPFIKWKLARKEPLKNWEYHLMQMVIADDPIKYLGDNLD